MTYVTKDAYIPCLFAAVVLYFVWKSELFDY
jgi:hypothetical protein